jgi:hypothetical protein
MQQLHPKEEIKEKEGKGGEGRRKKDETQGAEPTHGRP